MKNEKLVEKLIKEMDYPTTDELYDKLRSKLTKKEFNDTINKFFIENKILKDESDGRLVWVHNPELAKRIRDEGFLEL